MFFIIEGIENKELSLSEEEARAAHEAHVAFVNERIAAGQVKLAGPKALGGGGFIILKADSEEEAKDFIKADPSYINGVQSYKINAWNIFDIAPGLEGINK